MGDPCYERRNGMKLPNAAKAVVEREKVAGYLLNPAHPAFEKISIGKPERFAVDPRLLT